LQHKPISIAKKGSIGAFNFSRPEDVHTNPAPGKGNQIVFASTGRNTGINQAADLWGTTYVVDVKINLGRIQVDNITADISIIYDGDDADKRDFGIRSPDNLVWAKDGMVYIQEDRSITTFGVASNEETSIWKLNPKTSAVERIGQIDRTAVPAGQVDSSPSDLGNWESSGIIDVTDEFNAEGERILFFNTQAHSVGEGTIETENLVQGGQYLFISKPEVKGKGNKK
jgi:Predicted phosphatase